MRTLSRLQPGFVIKLDGRTCIVTMVNDSRAKAVPMTRKVKSFVPQTGDEATVGKPVTITVREEGYNISPNSECVILQAGTDMECDQRVKDFLAGKLAAPDEIKAPAPTPAPEQSTAATGNDDTMKSKTLSKPRPRGGLAADIANDKATKGKARATTPKATKAAKTDEAPAPKKKSKCAFIDDMLEATPSGKGRHTLADILDATCKEFGITTDADRKATAATIRARPAHMRKANRTPAWLPEAEEPKAKAAANGESK